MKVLKGTCTNEGKTTQEVIITIIVIIKGTFQPMRHMLRPELLLSFSRTEFLRVLSLHPGWDAGQRLPPAVCC